MQYDSVRDSIFPFLALSPSTLHKRLKEGLESPHSYSITIHNSSVPIVNGGEAGGKIRPQQLRQLLEGFRQFLPAEFLEDGEGGVVMSVSDHDLGGNTGSMEARRRLAELVEAGTCQYLPLFASCIYKLQAL